MMQGHYRPPKVTTDNAELLAQTGHAEDATKVSMTPLQQMVTAVVWRNLFCLESQGTVAGAQGSSHFVNVTPLTVLPENLIHGMVPSSEISSGLGQDAGTGSVADTSTFGPRESSPPGLQIEPHVNMICVFSPCAQPLVTMPQHGFPHGSGIKRRQQPIPREDSQALIASRSVLRTADPITPEEIGGIVGDSWTGILCWQRRHDGGWFQVQGVATDGIHNPCVYFSVRCKPVEGERPRRMFSKWPRLLQIQIVEAAVSSQDIQKWMKTTGIPVARIKCKPVDSHQFNDLVNLVRSGSVSRRSRSPTTLLPFDSTHWRTGRWDDRDFSSCRSTRTYCARSPRPASRAYQSLRRSSQAKRSAVSPQAPGCAPDHPLGLRLWASLRPNNGRPSRRCRLRRLRNRLNHIDEHSCEHHATQVTRVFHPPTLARQFRLRRFVYCRYRVFRFRQQADSQGPYSGQGHSKVSELHR
jgi:hypothetical protein